MAAPVNLDFSQPGPTPGAALGWLVNIVSNGVLVADYRGSRPQPVAFEDFATDWDANQTWAETLFSPTAAVYGLPLKPGGDPFEDFGFHWNNARLPAPPQGRMHAGAVDPDWGAPATGPYDVLLFILDPTMAVEYCAAEPPGSATPAWLPSTAYAVGDRVVAASGNEYLVVAKYGTGTSASGGNGPVGTGTYVDNPGPNRVVWVFVAPKDPLPREGEDFDVGWALSPAAITSIATGGASVGVTLAESHGIAVGQTFPVYLTGVHPSGRLNGLWPKATSTGPSTFTLPALRTSSIPVSGQAILETNLETNLRPPAWLQATPYHVGATVLSNGNWWQTVATGTSAGGGAGPIGQSPFVDNAGPNQVVWEPVRRAPAGPTYAASVGLYGAQTFDDFSLGWGVDSYHTTIPSPAAAKYRGWDADVPPAPAFVATDSHTYEAFFQLVPKPLAVASVDVGTSTFSLAPGQHLLDGGRVTLVATPPYAAYGSTYPSPTVPGVGYLVANDSPALGLDRLLLGDDSAAVFSNIVTTTSTNPSLVTTATPHGLVSGCTVFVVDHQLNTSIKGFLGPITVLSPTRFQVPVAGVAAGGATGRVYGPISVVHLTTAGSAQLTLAYSPKWDWAPPG